MLFIGLYMTFTDFRDNPILTTHNIVQVPLCDVFSGHKRPQEPDGMHFPDIYLCHTFLTNETLWNSFAEGDVAKMTDKYNMIYGMPGSSLRGGIGSAFSLAK